VLSKPFRRRLTKARVSRRLFAAFIGECLRINFEVVMLCWLEPPGRKPIADSTLSLRAIEPAEALPLTTPCFRPSLGGFGAFWLKGRMMKLFWVVLMLAVTLGISNKALAWEFAWINHGDQAMQQFGSSLIGIGDWNGDGYDDIIVGSAGLGISQLFYGGNPMDTLPDWTIQGTIIPVGDINGDGYRDLIIKHSAQIGDSSYIIFSLYWGGTGDALPDYDLDSTQFNGANGVIGPAGDINGDGYGDIWTRISNYPPGQYRGLVNLFLGNPNGLDSIPVWTIVGEQDNAGLGGGGYTYFNLNLEGNNLPDFLISTGFRGGIHEFLYHGKQNLNFEPDTSWDVYDIDHRDLNKIIGAYYLASYSPLGDLNGDGREDFYLHLQDTSYSGPSPTGIQTIMFGRDDLPNFRADAIINPGAAGSVILTNIGDVNGDGYNDLLGRRYNVNALGRIFIYLGGRWMNGDYSLEVTDDMGPFYWPIGRNAAWCGDVNGDGLNDIMFSQSGDGQLFTNGQVCIIAGSRNWRTDVEKTKEPSSVPKTFTITAIQPNPFNGELHIQIAVSNATDLKVSLFDIYGRTLGSLYSGRAEAGTKNITWNSTQSASGIYLILVVDSNGNRELRKAALMR
jgi:hypothetical protein